MFASFIAHDLGYVEREEMTSKPWEIPIEIEGVTYVSGTDPLREGGRYRI